MNRRNLLAAATLAPLAPLPARAEEGTTAIVVGSGPIGALAADRLRAAGIGVTVLAPTTPPVASLGVRLEQPRRSEWDLVYPPEWYDEFDSVYWPRARKHRAEPVTAAAHGPIQLREAEGGRFEVHCGPQAFHADHVFLAAGAVETTSLLVTARANGWLPRLRDDVGKGFGTNGTFLVLRLNQRDTGPDPARYYDDRNPFAPAAVAQVTAPMPAWARDCTAHLVLTVTPERGEVTAAGEVHWPYAPMQTKAEQAGRDLVTRLWWQTEGRRGRLLRGVPTYDRGTGPGLGAATTWHPLGGMVMGRATDHSGQSLDYPGLHCLDGSVLPGSTCLADPTLTIAANAERILDRFLHTPRKGMGG